MGLGGLGFSFLIFLGFLVWGSHYILIQRVQVVNHWVRLEGVPGCVGLRFRVFGVGVQVPGHWVREPLFIGFVV